MSTVNHGNLTIADLRRIQPGIPWTKPMFIVIAATEKEGYACRVCIANNGLRGDEFKPESEGDVIAHIQREHPE